MGKPLHGYPAKKKLQFIENKGQWDNDAAFVATINGGQLFVEKNALHFLFTQQQDLAKAFKHPRHFEEDFKSYTVRHHAVRITFVNGSEDAVVTGQQPEQTYYNYFLGNDPKYWHSGVKGFAQITAFKIYPFISTVLTTTDGGGIKYDIILDPGAKLANVKLKYEGQEKINLKNGNLHIKTSVNSWIEQKPYAYQLINGKQKEVACAFELIQHTVQFKLGQYDTLLPLIIDPQLIFSTYSGSSVDNFGHSATYDNDGNLYAAGIATHPTLFPNGSYPTTPGAFQQLWGGGIGSWPQAGFPCDISISKYTPDGSALVYATYLGGNRNDYPHSLVTDKNHNLIVFGTSLSKNYPTKTGSFDVTHNDSFDIIVTKLSADGTQLIGSTYIGGNGADGMNIADSLRMNYADEFRGEIMVAKNNDILIATSTSSVNFPVTIGAYQTIKSGKQDGCILRLDSNLTTLKFSTFIGQPENDALYSLDIDSAGSIYFSGGTQSTTFAVSPNTHLGNYHGGFCDGFIGNINASLSNITQLRYWGSNSYDQAYFIKLDPQSNPVVFGQHFDSIPIINADFSVPRSSLFVTKFKPSLDSIIFSTTIGDSIPNNALSPSAFMVDECGVIYGSVWSGITNRQGNYISKHGSQVITTTANLPITIDAIQSITDNSDFYLFVLDRNLDSLLYGTYFGESGDGDHVDGGTSRFDKKGIVYQSVCASCNGGTSGNFLTTPGSYSPTNLSPRCSNASFKLDFRKSNIVYAQFDYAPKKLCLDSYIVVTFTNQSYNGRYHFWYVNGVLKDTTRNFVDTITSIGNYTIKLLEIDSSRCIIIDSALVSFVVGVDAQASFTTIRDTCSSSITFTNTSTPSLVPIRWYFGNGDTSSLQIVTRTFPANGNYQILLLTNPGSGCLDTAVTNLLYDSIGHLVRASFIPLDSFGCEPAGFTFISTSNKFSNLRWYVNDTFASNSFVLDTFFMKGKYDIKLISIDSSTCNISDSSIHPITVVPYLYPDFTYIQDSCSFTVSFTNTTLKQPGDSIAYFWDFQNGITSHQQDTTVSFDTAGTYLVTLITNPGLACQETTTLTVQVTNLPGILNAYFVAEPTKSCTPAVIEFKNLSVNQQVQEWYYDSILVSTDSLLTDTFYTDTIIHVKLKIYSAITCVPADSFDTVIVVENNTYSIFSLIRDTCSSAVFFINQSQSDNGEMLTYTWYFGDGDSSTLQTPTHSYTIDSLYLVTLITNNGTYCADTSFVAFDYNQQAHLLTASFLLSDTMLCAPGIFSAINTSLNGNPIQWLLNDVVTSTDSIYTDTLIQPGDYTLTLIASNQSACTKTDTNSTNINIALSGIPDFNIARDSCSLVVQFKNKSYSSTGLPIPYIWYFGDGDSSTETNPTHTYAQSDNYYIQLITNNGSFCADTASSIFFIDGDSTQEITIPNVFTPNGDGLNDCYTVKGISAKCDEYKVTIYNRWGAIYFQSTNPNQCWNGKNEAGIDASQGVYFYIMEIKKRDQPKQERHGTISLIR